MAIKTKLDNKKGVFMNAMVQTFGNVTQSCKIVGIDRSLPYKWCETDKEFADKFHSNIFEETFLDMVDSKLAKLAIDENPTVLIFLAKTKGKKRGYVERSEFSGVDGKDLIPARILSKDEMKEFIEILKNEY